MQERICCLVLILVLPVAGVIITAVSAVNRKPEYHEELKEYLPKPKSLSAAAKSAGAVDRNAVSFYDILLTGDSHTKRSILLDILKGSAHRYIKQLKAALDDLDTETSHYASVALVEIKRKYDNTLIALNERLASDPDDVTAAEEYAGIIKSYVSSKILDPGNENRLKKNYIRTIKRFLDKGDKSLPVGYYTLLCDYLIDAGEVKPAGEYALKAISLFPENEEPYFELMKVYYRLGDTVRFAEAFDYLKRSSVMISKEGLSRIRFFSGRY
ncbi:MAG: bacterial transcriptional activator domain-containing protein [Eubacteriales bacterium]|nr:bacterial transcriptional activator domain-containing protein [Eubacteriales bacterium]